MASIEVKTKYFDFTFKKLRNAYLQVSLIFLTGGVASVTQSFWLQLLGKLSEKEGEDKSYIAEIIGLVLLSIGFYFFRLFIKAKRGSVYLLLYQHLNKEMGLMDRVLNLYNLVFDEKEALERMNNLRSCCKQSEEFVDNSRLFLDEDIYAKAKSIVDNHYKQSVAFFHFIENFKMFFIEKTAPKGDTYNPKEYRRYSIDLSREATAEFEEICGQLKQKVTWLIEE